MSRPALPTPTVNRNSKLTNEMSNNDNTNTAPMKKKKNHIGRRLCQLKKRLTLTSKSKSKTSSSNQEDDKVCLSPGTSAITSTSSFGQTSQEEEDTDVPIIDMMSMMTSLKPRVRSMFPEEEDDRMMMMPMMPALPAPPCPLSTTSTSTNEEERGVHVVTTTPLASFSSKLDNTLSVFSPNEVDDNDGDDDVGADDTNEWGVFASYDDEDKEEEHHKSEDQTYNYNDHHKFKPFSRSSFTKHTSHPCFPPRTHLPVVFAATTVGAE